MDTLYKILQLIKKNGLTENEFTKKVGLNKSAVSDWKSGKTSSYNKHLPKIAEVLDVSIDYLLDNSIPTNKNNDEKELNLNSDELLFLIEYRKLSPRKKTILIGKLYELVDNN